MKYVRSFIFSIGWYLNVILILPIFGLIIIPFNFRTKHKIIGKWCYFSLLWLKITCKIDYKIHGLENLANLEKSPALILPKHQSTFETFLIPAIFPPHVFVVKKELFRIPIFGWVLAIMESIGIDRSAGGSAFKKIVKHAKEKFSQGTSVIMFPEGTRVKVGDDTQYKSGAFHLAKLLKTPIIPVGHNAGKFWAKGQFVKESGTIDIFIGDPISPEEKSSEELMQTVKDWIEKHSA